MKKKIIRFSALAFLLIFALINVSCGGGSFRSVKLFYIELHDEKDNVIIGKKDLESFEVSQIDNYTGKNKFDGKIYIEMKGKTASGDDEYSYELFYYLGEGKLVSTEQRYERKLKKQMEKTGLRILDKQARYKTYELYPLSDYLEYNNAYKLVVKGDKLIVKLDKK